METVKFTSTVFQDKGKRGILKPDENGYYTVVLGALNSYNSAGEFYTADRVLQLFEESSQLQRRIKNGALFAELGHPKKSVGMSNDQYYYRIISLEETNICAHISEVRLDFEYGKRHPELGSPDLIAVIGKVKPTGPYGELVKTSLETAQMNTSFSVRGITDNSYEKGVTMRRLTTIVTWDWVPEGGISIASKAHSPALEDKDLRAIGKSCELMDVLIDPNTLQRAANTGLAQLGLESAESPLFKELIEQTKPKVKATSKLSKW